MKKFKTSIIAFTLLLLASLVLVACGDKADKDQVAVDAAKETLVLGLQAPDTLENVTQDITLPATAGEGVTVVWASSNTAVISVAGKVERQAENTNVKLTATLSKGDATANKEFNVVVAKADTAAVDAAVAALIAHYAETLGNDEWKATANVTLVSTLEGHDVAITWAVIQGGSNFTTAGVVTRPTFTEGDVTVQLRATIGSRTHNFYFLIEKLEETVEEKINKALNLVTIVPATPSGYQETNFAAVATTKIDGNDVAVTWTSSDLTAMTNAGVLVSFDDVEEKEVTLTASITYDGVTLTKDVVFLVKGVTTYDSLLGALVDANKNEKVKVNGVAHFDDLSGGYYIASSDNLIVYVHGSKPASLKAGKLYDVIFTVDIFHGSFQAKDVSFSNERDGDLPVITPIEMTLEELVNLPKPTEVSFNQTYITLVDVKVRVDDPADNYKTFFVPQDLAADAVLTDKNSIMVYYQSKIDIIKGLNGKKINSINLINNGYRTNNIVWYVNFTQTLGDIDLSLTPAEEVDVALSTAANGIAKDYYFAGSVALPTTSKNVTISWETSHPEIIALDGTITLPETRTEVTLTATATSTDDPLISDSVEIKVWVGDLAKSDISALLAGTNGTAMRIQGVITSFGPYNSFTIEDGTGAVAFRIGGRHAASTDLPFVVGTEISAIVTRNTFGGLIQGELVGGDKSLDKITVVAEAQALPAAVNLNDVDLTNENLVALQSHLVSLDNVLVTKFSTANFGNVEMTLTRADGNSINFKWDIRTLVPESTIATLKVGDVVNLVAAPLSVASNAPIVMYDALTQVVVVEELGNDVKLEFDVATYSATTLYLAVGDLALPTVGSAYESVITYAFKNAEDANNALIDLATMKVVEIPAEGQKEVHLVATFTLGSDTELLDVVLKIGESTVGEMFRHYKFDEGVYAGNGTGYGFDAAFTWNETFGSETVKKDRVQINKSKFAPHDDEAMLVFSLRATYNREAYIEFDFSDLQALTQISFRVSAWNNTLMDQVKAVPNGKLALQIKNGDNWDDVKTVNGEADILQLLVADEYVEFMFNTSGAGVYRIVYSGDSTATGNTTTAITVDDLKLYN